MEQEQHPRTREDIIKDQEDRARAFWDNEDKRIKEQHEAWAKATPQREEMFAKAQEEQDRLIKEALQDKPMQCPSASSSTATDGKGQTQDLEQTRRRAQAQ